MQVKTKLYRATAVIFHGNKMCPRMLPPHTHTHRTKKNTHTQTHIHKGNAKIILHTTTATTTTIVILTTNFTLQNFTWELSVVHWG